MKPNDPKFLVVVAGVPGIISEQFKGKIASLEEGRRQFIWLPLDMTRGYNPNYVKQIFNNFYDELRRSVLDTSTRQSGYSGFQGAMTVFLKHRRNDDLVERAFSIETLTMSVPMPDWLGHSRYSDARCGQAANEIATSIKRVVRRGEKVLSAVYNQVNSNDNQTPFLLPERNFDSSKIGELARSVGTIALEDNDVFEAVKNLVATFKAQNPRVKGPNNRDSFRNKRNLLFQGPGSARHGFANSVSKEHKKQCLIRGRIRFGAPYDPRFHYDCVKLKGSLATSWKSCHEQEVTISPARTHINISPNDYVR